MPSTKNRQKGTFFWCQCSAEIEKKVDLSRDWMYCCSGQQLCERKITNQHYQYCHGTTCARKITTEHSFRCAVAAAASNYGRKITNKHLYRYYHGVTAASGLHGIKSTSATISTSTLHGNTFWLSTNCQSWHDGNRRAYYIYAAAIIFLKSYFESQKQ